MGARAKNVALSVSRRGKEWVVRGAKWAKARGTNSTSCAVWDVKLKSAGSSPDGASTHAQNVFYHVVRAGGGGPHVVVMTGKGLALELLQRGIGGAGNARGGKTIRNGGTSVSNVELKGRREVGGEPRLIRRLVEGRRQARPSWER